MEAELWKKDSYFNRTVTLERGVSRLVRGQGIAGDADEKAHYEHFAQHRRISRERRRRRM
jgi:hypothetical protein